MNTKHSDKREFMTSSVLLRNPPSPKGKALKYLCFQIKSLTKPDKRSDSQSLPLWGRWRRSRRKRLHKQSFIFSSNLHEIYLSLHIRKFLRWGMGRRFFQKAPSRRIKIAHRIFYRQSTRKRRIKVDTFSKFIYNNKCIFGIYPKKIRRTPIRLFSEKTE